MAPHVDLRAQIEAEIYKPGDPLPTREELGATYGVATQTIQNALGELRKADLIVSRQGSRAFVRHDLEQHLGLRPNIDRAFTQPEVAIDFVGFTGTNFRDVINEPLNKILLGRLAPASVSIRMLLPDLRQPIGLPCQADTRDDSPEFRRHATTIIHDNVAAITKTITQITSHTPVAASVQARIFRTTPLFTLFLLNHNDVFFGYYPIREHIVSLDEQPTAIFDLMSTDITLLHHSAEDSDPTSRQHVNQAHTWFSNVWNTIATELTA